MLTVKGGEKDKSILGRSTTLFPQLGITILILDWRNRSIN